MILRIKSFVYRHTGFFLAHKELLDYIKSHAYWQAHNRILRNPKNNLDSRIIQSILIGMWQVDHGFYRSYSFTRRKKL